MQLVLMALLLMLLVLLLSAGANANLADNKKQTALHLACKQVCLPNCCLFLAVDVSAARQDHFYMHMYIM